MLVRAEFLAVELWVDPDVVDQLELIDRVFGVHQLMQRRAQAVERAW